MQKIGNLIKKYYTTEQGFNETHYDQNQRQQIKKNIVKADETNQELEITENYLTGYLNNNKALQRGIRLSKNEAKKIMPKGKRYLKEDNEFVLFFRGSFYLEGQESGKAYNTKPEQTRVIRDNLTRLYPNILGYNNK